MSGIVGILRPGGGTVDGSEIADMLDAIEHREIDGRSAWCGGDVGFGHARRHFTPEDRHETWPLHAAEGAISLIADARLDNREELVSTLGLSRHERGFHTDGELILAAFRRWGEGCPAHLLGDFAFAVWDAGRRRLFLARDHFGAKPLFHHRAADGTFVFGSEIKALFAAADISRTPDEFFVAYHFGVPVTGDGSSTFYAAVKSLPPAHTLSVDAGGLRMREFWTLDDVPELRLPSSEAYAEGFRDHFEASVRARLRSVTPVGVTLSGGLDSSTIASVAAKLAPGRVRSFSAIFPDALAADERAYQRSVVERWNLPHAEYAADAASPLTDYADVVRHLDGWQTAGNLRLNWNLYRLAAGQGVRVMLEGFDGDTVVSHGLGFFGELAQRRAWLRLAVEVGAHARVKQMPVVPTVWSWMANFRVYPLLRAYGLLQHWLRLERLGARITRHAPAHEQRLPWRHYLNADFVGRVRGTARGDLPQTERAHHARALLRSIRSPATQMLNACGAGFGVDVRYPFFDRRLVEFCVSLPPEQKIRRGLTRLILRRAMRGIVPDLVLARKDKTNIEPGLAHALWTHERPRVSSVLRSGALDELADYVDVPTFREIFTRYEQGNSSAHDRLVVWQTLAFLLWLQESAAPA